MHILDESFIEIIPWSGCWIWMRGCTSSGYGVVYLEHHTPKYAHRASYEKHIGPIPPGLHILHTCDIPSCINPAHLYAGTNQDNIRDRMIRGRSKGGIENQPTCGRGHVMTNDNLWIGKDGRRQCKTCGSLRNYLRRRK